jgi:ribosome-associated protein
MTNLSTSAISALSTDDQITALAHLIADAADDRKAGDITIIKVGEVSSLADYFIIATGFSKVQVRAIAGAIEDKVEETLNRLPRHLEGMNDGTWVLVDYVLMPDEREYYNLEAFWAHGEQIPFEAKPN